MNTKYCYTDLRNTLPKHKDEGLKTKRIAVLDMGSNSFRLLLASRHGEHYAVEDYQRWRLQLANGLDANNHLSEKAIATSLPILASCKRHIQDFAAQSVRAVATNTVRVASNQAAYITQAEAALGWPIDVVAGDEEATLIYLGVVSVARNRTKQRLVIDIGGGSTELIVGSGDEIVHLTSIPYGCIGMKKLCLSGPTVTLEAFDKAVNIIVQALAPQRQRFIQAGWQSVKGCSGTIKACVDILSSHHAYSGAIHLDDMHYIRSLICHLKDFSALTKFGIEADRYSIFPGGFAILYALFKSLIIESIKISHAALREGVVYQMTGLPLKIQ